MGRRLGAMRVNAIALAQLTSGIDFLISVTRLRARIWHRYIA